MIDLHIKILSPNILVRKCNQEKVKVKYNLNYFKLWTTLT